MLVDPVMPSPSTTPRVRVTGRKRYDNKGNVVEKWEPFFDTGWSFDDVSGSEPRVIG